ncbi:MAG TPA: metalloregulator ArsR/SmtB family transcription factor [Mycobacteriales bacterium]|nr:metalloregulator ArsR/SmtB family transcription factor [Mycobacteriales bacterium]
MREGYAVVRKLLPLDQPAAAAPCCAPIRDALVSTREATTLAKQFAALSDPVRIRLLSMIANDPDGAVCACDLVEPAGRSQPTVSHHLKVLREAGLLTSERRGVNNWYAAVPAALESLRAALSTG